MKNNSRLPWFNLMMRRTKLVLAMALVVGAALLCVEYFWLTEGLPGPRVLADASVLKVESVSFGIHHRYQEASPKAWQLAIGKKLPYALAARLGWRFDTRGSMDISNPDGMTSLVLFTKREGLGGGATNNIRVIVLDDQGHSLGGNEGGGTLGSLDSTGRHYHHLQSWDVPAFPRRGKTLFVRFLWEQGSGKVDVPIMQFHIANPQPGQYPIWTSEPWPATKNTGDLSVTLTDFTTGLSKSEPTRAALENEKVVTQLTLDLEAKGQTNCPWHVKLVEVSDATGNRWNAVPWGNKIKAHQQDLTQTMNLSGNLWSGESAWKLRFELAPTSGVTPDGKSQFVEFIAKPRTLTTTIEKQRSQ